MRVPWMVSAGLSITGLFALLAFIGLYTPMTADEVAANPEAAAEWYNIASLVDLVFLLMLFVFFAFTYAFIRNLPSAETRVQSSGSEAPLRICIKCGTQVLRDAAFCAYCGNSLAQLTEEATPG